METREKNKTYYALCTPNHWFYKWIYGNEARGAEQDFTRFVALEKSGSHLCGLFIVLCHHSLLKVELALFLNQYPQKSNWSFIWEPLVFQMLVHLHPK